jgi:hypothetical protein
MQSFRRIAAQLKTELYNDIFLALPPAARRRFSAVIFPRRVHAERREVGA